MPPALSLLGKVQHPGKQVPDSTGTEINALEGEMWSQISSGAEVGWDF